MFFNLKLKKFFFKKWHFFYDLFFMIIFKIFYDFLKKKCFFEKNYLYKNGN